MDVYRKIIEVLRQEYESGATYKELADKYGISYTHMHNLLNGKRAVSGISLDFFFKLFPDATLTFSGGNFTNVVNNGGKIKSISTNDNNDAINKILTSDELSDAEKVKVLKVLRK
ncbi:MAG: hypothetical protein IKC77_07060 [Lentisphaeria bacterium]|nr:hypothetical protein [Lentisphaeria bacterium]